MIFIELGHNELREKIPVEVEPGSLILSPDRLRANEEHKRVQQEIAEREMFREAQKKEERKMGPYYTVTFERYETISLTDNATLARFFYLVSYMGYDSRLMNTKRKVMTKMDAQRIMRLSTSTFYRFWSEIEEKGLIKVQPNGEIAICSSMFHRGSISATGYSRGWMRIYRRIRELYESVPASKHRYIGAILRMIPYINIEYNVLCYDPLETDIHEIEPMSMEAFCKEIGMTARNAEYYRDQYERITFHTEKGKASFCRSLFTSDGSEYIYINPEIMFAGQIGERVEHLALYFRNQGKPNFLHEIS